MKKLVLMFVAIAAISFASCGNKTAQGEGADSLADTTVQDTMPSDTMPSDTMPSDTMPNAAK